jgi:hypothetical protein
MEHRRPGRHRGEGERLCRQAPHAALHAIFNEDGVIAASVEQEAEPVHAQGGKRQWSLQMELTRIRLAGADTDTHWSLAFEAHPDDPSCRAPFAKAVATLLAGYPARPLAAERSMSYPRWLQRLASKMIP